jgi:4-amino-4-deoxy-L-arabinose transferase-like glycosyltransferase
MAESIFDQNQGGLPPNQPHLFVAPLRGQWWVIGLLVAAHAALVLLGTACDSATYCEPANLASGIVYWEYGRTDLYSVNPPLSKAIAAFPVRTFLPLDIGGIAFPLYPGVRPEFEAGDQLMRANSNLYWWMLILGRLSGLVWSLVGAWLVHRWAGQLFGPGPGVVALAVWCFEPTIITFAHLITPDLPAAVMTLAASYAFWRYLKTPAWGPALAAGGLLGAALLTKFTLVVLVPTFAVLGVVASCSLQTLRWRTGVSHLLALNLVALFVLNLGYGFEGTGAPIGQVPFVSRMLSGQPVDAPAGQADNRFRATGWGHLPSPFPEHFLRGIDVQKHDFEMDEKDRAVYLNGEWKVGGWYHYYLYAMLVKLPVGLGLIVLLGVGWWVGNYRRFHWIDYGCVLLVGLVLFAFVSSQKALNRHFRDVLLVLPGLIVAGGAAASWAGNRRWRFWTVAALVGLQAGSVAAQAPHTLGYFNELAGGPQNGWRHLSGSNLDWGQDLWWLKRWLERHPDTRPLYLAWYGRPACQVPGLGVVARPPQDPGAAVIPADVEDQRRLGPWPGRYAVSILHLQSAATAVANGPGGSARGTPVPYGYLWHFEPVAFAGTSLRVYDISLEEANRVRALYGLVPLREEDLGSGQSSR